MFSCSGAEWGVCTRGEKTEKTGAEKQMATLVLFLDEHEGHRADLTPD